MTYLLLVEIYRMESIIYIPCIHRTKRLWVLSVTLILLKLQIWENWEDQEIQEVSKGQIIISHIIFALIILGESMRDKPETKNFPRTTIKSSKKNPWLTWEASTAQLTMVRSDCLQTLKQDLCLSKKISLIKRKEGMSNLDQTIPIHRKEMSKS